MESMDLLEQQGGDHLGLGQRKGQWKGEGAGMKPKGWLGAGPQGTLVPG